MNSLLQSVVQRVHQGVAQTVRAPAPPVAEPNGATTVAEDGDASADTRVGGGNMLEDGGSIPSPLTNLHRKWEVRLAEDHLCETGVYLRRWRLETPWFSIRLHHWFASDDDRSMHDHPWDFITMPLRGSYVDETPAGPQRVRAGRIYYRPSTHAHWVHLDRGRVWTLVLTGPKVRRWGFLVGRKWTIAYRYFYRFGNHPCDS